MTIPKKFVPFVEPELDASFGMKIAYCVHGNNLGEYGNDLEELCLVTASERCWSELVMTVTISVQNA